MTDAHTPGPWHIDRTGEHHGQRPYGIRSGQRGLTRRNVVIWGGLAAPASPEAEANARLIAAAPTMFDYIAARAADGDPEATQIMKSLKATTTFNAGERG